ncbi:MAG: GerMN domain-containing protein [Eubacteriales bacterium]|nr:GerMN domain-containing protein [Eubacteriales bacterium]
MKLLRKYMLLLAALFLAGVCSGCSGEEEPLKEGERSYQVYYLNPGMTRLVPSEYRTDTSDPDALVKELFDCMQNAPADLDAQVALSEKVVYQGARREDMVLYLFFDTNYTSMPSVREILCRAALTKTMTQIEGIDYINIYSGEQPLLDSSGMPVGALSAADFVEGISDINAYERTELTLYFTDEEGSLLYPETRSVMHNINTSVERMILDELISGPETPGLQPTLPPDTKLLNVSVNENVCYLNFDSSFLTNPLEVKDYIPIYSIVNSLSVQHSVNRVQITVNGEQNVMFRDAISLSTIFERNLDYIGGTEN